MILLNNCVGHKRLGLSLIELVVVIALICVIASLALVNSSFVHRFAVRAEAEKFASICRFLQQTAMSSNTEQKLIFDVPTNSYRFNESHEKLSRNVRFGVGKRTVLGPPSAPTKPITQAITYTDNTIAFYPDGVIKSGLVYFSDLSGKYVYAVSSPIGDISLLRLYVYDGKWTQLK